LIVRYRILKIICSYHVLCSFDARRSFDHQQDKK
jgi:hypothetical protein